MSFLKDFKEDLTQAVNELVADEPATEAAEKTEKSEKPAKAAKTSKSAKKEVANEESMDNEMVNTLDDEVLADLDLDAISDLMEDVPEVAQEEQPVQETVEEPVATEVMPEEVQEEVVEASVPEAVVPEAAEPVVTAPEPVVTETKEEEPKDLPSDELTEITKGTSITGNVVADGSLNIYGKIVGDISCKGKMIITGTVKGTSQAGEIFANNAKIEGDVKSSGSVKIGNGSVIVGNVYATSAVIGGAVKGDIDVHGPVIVDATAVVQGNIKSRSVQINNGAAIEGFCSQCYADIDYKALFEDTFSEI